MDNMKDLILDALFPRPNKEKSLVDYELVMDVRRMFRQHRLDDLNYDELCEFFESGVSNWKEAAAA